MAFKKNDIALSFDKAEYYSLEEASEYLNRKHGIDNIAPRKLLKHIASYDTPCFVYGKGFEVTGDFNTSIPDNLSAKDYDYNSEKSKDRINRVHKLVAMATEMLSNVTYGDGIFLQLHSKLVRFLPLYEKIKTLDFDESEIFIGALPINEIGGNSRTLNYLEKYFMQYHNEHITEVLALYPNMTFNADDFDNQIANETAFNNISLKVIDYYDSRNEENNQVYVNPYFEITINNLIILHSDLQTLSNQIIDNTPIPEKEPPKFTDVQTLPRIKGKSPKKVLVQEMARFYALSEWENDSDKSIKQTAMASIVWRKLAEAGFSDELQSTDQVKTWINPVAPPHAREAGRPTNS